MTFYYRRVKSKINAELVLLGLLCGACAALTLLELRLRHRKPTAENPFRDVVFTPQCVVVKDGDTISCLYPGTTNSVRFRNGYLTNFVAVSRIPTVEFWR